MKEQHQEPGKMNGSEPRSKRNQTVVMPMKFRNMNSYRSKQNNEVATIGVAKVKVEIETRGQQARQVESMT